MKVASRPARLLRSAALVAGRVLHLVTVAAITGALVAAVVYAVYFLSWLLLGDAAWIGLLLGLPALCFALVLAILFFGAQVGPGPR